MKSDIEAIEIAKNYINIIYPGKLASSPIQLDVEEVINEGSDCLVTISFRANSGEPGNIIDLMGGIKKYKQVTVDKGSGQVKSMKILSL